MISSVIFVILGLLFAYFLYRALFDYDFDISDDIIGGPDNDGIDPDPRFYWRRGRTYRIYK